MKRLSAALCCLLFAGCAMFDEYDTYYDDGFYGGGFYEQPMPAQAAYIPTTPPITTAASCNGCGSASRPAHQAGYQTGEPPMLKQTDEPPK